MNIFNYFSVIFCLIVFSGSFFIGGEVAIYYNSVAALVVIPGIIGSTFFSYPFNRIQAACRVAFNTYTKAKETPTEVINTLLNMNIRSRYEGMLSLEGYSKKGKLSYIDRALSLLVDNYNNSEISEILMSEMQFFKLRRQQSERIFRHMAHLSPAFGIAGSVIGLISITGGIQNTDVILQNIPIALTSTLYGILLGYTFFTPIAENIHDSTHKELVLQRIILSGIIAIRSETNTYKLETRLTSFVTPSERNHLRYNIRDIANEYKGRKTIVNRPGIN